MWQDVRLIERLPVGEPIIIGGLPRINGDEYASRYRARSRQADLQVDPLADIEINPFFNGTDVRAAGHTHHGAEFG